MRATLKLLCTAILLGGSVTASAWGNNGWDWNPWPAWTPMYWMEEMVGGNNWYDDYYGGPYGYGGYGPYGPGYGPYRYGPGYGVPYSGYGGYPYGGYGGGYGNPYVNPWR